jgi:flagellar basal-body rod protein FlgB
MRNDGNGVDMEFETVQAVKTQMRYQLMSSMMSRNFRKISMLFR